MSSEESKVPPVNSEPPMDRLMDRSGGGGGLEPNQDPETNKMIPTTELLPLPSRNPATTGATVSTNSESTWHRWFAHRLTRVCPLTSRHLAEPGGRVQYMATVNSGEESIIIGDNPQRLYCKLPPHILTIAIIILSLIVFATLILTAHLITSKCNKVANKSETSLSSSTPPSLPQLLPPPPPYHPAHSTSVHQLSGSKHPQVHFPLHHHQPLPLPEHFVDTRGEPFPWASIRLPPYIRPVHYDLFMNPSMQTFVNTGFVDITIQLDSNYTSQFLVLHSKKLQITSVEVFAGSVNQSEESPVKVVRQQECVQLEQLYIEVNERLSWQHYYRVVIQFRRQLDDQLEGFYISNYLNANSKTIHHLLTTHFQPTMARTAFPCFDEPAMKASFALKMIHDRKYQVYFNTALISRKPVDSNLNDTKYISEFERTVPMSTYLVGFVVCDFAEVSLKSEQGISIRAVVPYEQEKNSHYALQSASRVITYFDNFFKIPYPLKKLDLIVVPDFGAGAMENWGIITFRTSTLLYNEKESSLEAQEQVAIVVAHEIAHQWFGNLVTMDWWNDLWLNEGFASFVENLGVNHLHPEWRMLDQFVISTTQQALSMDSLLSSHAINTTVTNPAEIEAIFDMISYKKGSCLIRMLMSFLGLENLKSGLEKYLSRYKFKTAKTNQLWDCFSEVSTILPHNVSAIMHTWTLQKGYPLIYARWDSEGVNIVVEQRPFVSSLSPGEFEKSEENFTQNWVVPLTIVSSLRNESKLYWLDTRSMQIPLLRMYNDWFKLNHQQSGFYRVNYDVNIWRDLIRMLVNSEPNHHQLSPSDRAGLIDDALSLMRIGYLDVNTAMDLTRYLGNSWQFFSHSDNLAVEFAENDYVPWETTLNHFGVIDSLMLQHPMLHRYIRRLIGSLVERLGWQEKQVESVFEKKLRAIILRAAVFYGDREAIRISLGYFQQWMQNGTTIPANIRDIVYHSGAQFGGDAEWFHCWNKYLNTSMASEKRLLLGVLGSTRNHYLLSLYLNASLNRTLVRTQDTYFVIMNAARNPIGREQAWKFIRSNWNYIYNLFGQGSFAIDTIITETTWHFFTQFEYNEVEHFFNTVAVGSGKQAVRQNLEKIRANIYWKSEIEPRLIRWLSRIANASSE